jgi:hypothetical protein
MLSHRFILALAGLFTVCLAASSLAQSNSPVTAPRPQGQYFLRKEYSPHRLPKFSDRRDELPAPIYDGNPDWVRMYWKAWELAFRNFHEPASGSGFVTQFIDAAFNQNIFLWDTCFMTMFCNVAHPLVPGIGSLDNFYAKQHADGEICREIDRATGLDYAQWVNREGKDLFSRWGWNVGPNDPVIYRGRDVPQPPPLLTLDALNHPIFAWAELESYRMTGDAPRLHRVYEPLRHYYRALEKYLRQGNGLFMTDWASMDNSPRNPFLKSGGCGVDISCQMVLFARNLAEMARLVGSESEASRFEAEAERVKGLINDQMWDDQRGFYFDLTQTGGRAPVKTIAAYWALLAKVATPSRARALVAELQNPKTFARLHCPPTLAADEKNFDPAGGYWRGAVWPPTTTLVIRGLENYGYDDLARGIALHHLTNIGRVFLETGTVWENYAPDFAQPGKPAKPDFVGWSGIGPILYLIEYGVGLKANAPDNELVWQLRSTLRHGCERFRFNGHVVSLTAAPAGDGTRTMTITVKSNGGFKLRLIHDGQSKNTQVEPGEQTLVSP